MRPRFPEFRFHLVRFSEELDFGFEDLFLSGFCCCGREFHLFWNLKRLVILKRKENL
ncbi:hypothetical protein LEP1GSC188_3320 [Leptospira weilii serovar Topaz str. LT2116]|uniref:Uncharacterized protein n=1 Tax=Leptospira weilii serovar Topaz str. LT2116 TaxID=1088540 RepID=M3H076_9LEPT|nr:hypothetical protein LEP1GSC188_3320 [Leptospira weilii serovar Topaz str. LT2116]